jgi:hypothetical protein
MVRVAGARRVPFTHRLGAALRGTPTSPGVAEACDRRRHAASEARRRRLACPRPRWGQRKRPRRSSRPTSMRARRVGVWEAEDSVWQRIRPGVVRPRRTAAHAVNALSNVPQHVLAVLGRRSGARAVIAPSDLLLTIPQGPRRRMWNERLRLPLVQSSWSGGYWGGAVPRRSITRGPGAPARCSRRVSSTCHSSP